MKSARAKWLKRLLLLLTTVLVVLLGGALVVVLMIRAQPSYYRPVQLTPAQRADAAKRAEDKFIRIQNQVARAHAAEVSRRHRAATVSSTQPIVFDGEPVTISFTEAELNAFFEKWSSFQNWKASYEPYIEDPVVILRDDRVVLAAKLKEPNVIASLHFDATIDADGQLRLELARILGGMLPLPEGVIRNHRDRLTSDIARKLPAWQASADIDSGGAVNSSAIAAATAKLFVRMLRHEPIEPVLFLPVFGQKGSVPVRIQSVHIVNGELMLTIQPLNPAEQVELLKHIRTPEPVSAPAGSPR